MYKKAYQKDWALVSVICLAAVALTFYVVDFSSAVGPASSSQSFFVGNQDPVVKYPDCGLPDPVPDCTDGQTLCSEGTNGELCHATTYTCSGNPPRFDPDGERCTLNACTGGPGTVGSECQ